MEPTIEVKVSRLAQLLTTERFLDCLSEAGVDNWCGYDDARDEYKKLGGKVPPTEEAVRAALG